MQMLACIAFAILFCFFVLFLLFTLLFQLKKQQQKTRIFYLKNNNNFLCIACVRDEKLIAAEVQCACMGIILNSCVHFSDFP